MQHVLATLLKSCALSLILIAPVSAALLDYNATATSSLALDSGAGREDLAKGLEALRKKQFDQALAAASKVIADHPENFRGHLLLSLALIAKGDNQQLDTHLQELNKVAPSYASAVCLNLAKYFYDNKQYYRTLAMLERVSQPSDQAERLLLTARTYESQRQLDDAISTYSKLLKEYPKHDEVMVDLSRLYLVQDNYQQANHYASSYLGKYPGDDKAAFNVSISNLLLGNFQQALDGFLKLQKAGDQSLQVHTYTALSYLLTGKTEQAQAQLASLSTQDLKVFEVQFLRALLDFKLNDFKAAQQPLDYLQSNNAEDPLTHLFLAVQQQQQGNFAAVQKEIQAASSELLDWNRAGDIGAAKFFNNTEDYIQAAELAQFYREGLHHAVLQLGSKAPNSLTARIFMARSQWQLGQVDAARKSYQNLIKDYPKLIAPRLELADIDFHQKDGDAAIQGYEMVTRMVPDNLGIKINLGNLYNTLGKVDKALELYKDILLRAPGNAFLLNQIAATYAEKKNDFKSALDYGLKAAKSDPRDLSIKDTLAFIYLHTGELARAKKLYDDILETTQYNQSPETFYRIAETYDGLGQLKQAQLFYELAVNSGHAFDGYAKAEQRLKSLWGT